MAAQKKLTKKQVYLINQMRIVNETLSTLLDRSFAGRGGKIDPRRDLNQECGYPEKITTADFWNQYRRSGIAARTVNIFPDSCFAVDPEPYESESERFTPFENSWIDLAQSPSVSLTHYCHRVDILSGINRYGGLLLGVDDGKNLSQPLEGADRYDDFQADEKPLAYIRAFDETQLTVASLDRTPGRHYGMPEMYNMRLLSQSSMGDMVGMSGPALPTDNVEVHWTRVLHVADNRTSSETFGMPRMEQVFNWLLDVNKVLGPSAEMYYKGGFPGLSLELDPRIAEVMDVDIDEDSIEAEMFAYMNGLQRYLWLQGINAKSLAPQVSDPRPAVEALLNAIAMSIGAPLRIFMGSEQAQLASGQDVRTWNGRIRKRQNGYLTPMLIRPLIDRLIRVGVMKKPRSFDAKTGTWNYKVFWPDVNLPNEDERSQIADRRASAIEKYMRSMAYQVMQFRDFMRFILGFDQREIAAIMKNSKKEPELKIEPPKPQGGDSGVAGKPPSKANPKPRPGGKKD